MRIHAEQQTSQERHRNSRRNLTEISNHYADPRCREHETHGAFKLATVEDMFPVLMEHLSGLYLVLRLTVVHNGRLRQLNVKRERNHLRNEYLNVVSGELGEYLK